MKIWRKQMEWCKKCVQTDTRPQIKFVNGICGACWYEENKSHIDWNKRASELTKIVDEAYDKHADYDCVIGVSGGKDSTYQALYARDTLGLRCLLVNSEPEGITEIGKLNIENLINLGFDVIKIRPNPIVMKQLMKRDFYKYLNPVKITEYSLWSSAYIIADKFKIPLIIQGENPALTLGVSNGLSPDGNALNVDKQNTLKDGWEQYKDTVFEEDLYLFHYPKELLTLHDIKAIWLQYYDKDWSPNHNAEFSVKHGLTVRTNFNPEDIGTYVNYAQLDSDLVQVNQMFKYYKFGFGQCTDYACYDIREGRLKREDAWELLEKYDGKCAERYIKKFCDYIGITVEEMWRVVDKSVNKYLFHIDKYLYQQGNGWIRSFEYGK